MHIQLHKLQVMHAHITCSHHARTHVGIQCKHFYTHVNTPSYTYIHLTHTHKHFHMYKHTCTCTYTHAYSHTHHTHTFKYIHTCTCTQTLMHTNTIKYACISTYISIHADTRTYTHTLHSCAQTL